MLKDIREETQNLPSSQHGLKIWGRRMGEGSLVDLLKGRQYKLNE